MFTLLILLILIIFKKLYQFIDNSEHIRNYLRPFTNWKFLICFLPPWMITNGLWYIGFSLGIKFHIPWLRNICGAYIAWLYTPLAMEKIIIIPIAIILCKWWFKNDEKTRTQLDIMLHQAKEDFKKLLLFFGFEPKPSKNILSQAILRIRKHDVVHWWKKEIENA